MSIPVPKTGEVWSESVWSWIFSSSRLRARSSELVALDSVVFFDPSNGRGPSFTLTIMELPV